MHQVKLLQLIRIHKQGDTHYLHIMLHANEKTTYYWQVDRETAIRLQAITDFSKGYFYQLSWDTTHRQSHITQTYRNESKNLGFICSKRYAEQLTQIQHAESTEQLEELAFLSRNLAFKQETSLSGSRKQRKQRKLPWPLTATFILLLAILSSFTCHAIFTNVNADSEKQEETPEQPIQEEPKPETMLPEDTMPLEEKRAIPAVALNAEISSGLDEGMVALTFDDGPSDYSKQIVDILMEFGAGGTFFLIGSNMDEHPDSVEYIHDNNFSIGTHSLNHINFASSSLATQKGELQQSIEMIEAVTGEAVTLFRPPYGQMNEDTKQLSRELGQRIVLWNNDPKDWESRNASNILQQVKSQDVSGSIILLHETEATVEALPEIISYLQEQGLQLVSLQ
ncbi:polysaccharide deacetylase family protein [Ornithinibacillus sp. FSL M8-0202]|uniref:polysaccharide deacetylase family protein n=1 Tax=Ornithinibacillus sp. FSL M8-0202 TaxID=2921616 RepID=UPI0030CFDBAE